MDSGRNCGISGIVDMIGFPQFGGQVYAWSESTTVSSVENTGQGSGDLGDSLALIENGNVILTGKFRKDLFPFPAALKNASGTLTFMLSKGIPGSGQADVKMSATFRIDKVEVKFNEKDETLWDFIIGGQRLSALTPSGFNNNSTNNTATARTPGNTYLYAGREKTYDPAPIGPIADRSTQAFNVWGVSTDTDAAELTAITTIIAAYVTPPQSREKVHLATVVRLSSSVVRIALTWKQLNTQDEIEVPAKSNRVDPWGINTALASAQVFALSAIPGAVTPPSGLKLVSETDGGLNKFLSVRRREFAPNDSKSAIEIPGTSAYVDPNDLSSRIGSAVYFKLSAGVPVPALSSNGMKLVGHKETGINPFVSVQTREYAKNDSKDALELPATVTHTDPSKLQSTATIARVNATVSTLTGFALRGTSKVQLTAGGTTSWLTTTHFGLRTIAEDITFPGNVTMLDPNSLHSVAVHTIISNDTTTTYAAPTGLKIVSRKWTQMTSALGTDNQWVGVWQLATRSTADNATFPHTSSSRAADTPFLDSDAQIVGASGTVASQANTLWTAFQGVAYARGLRLLKLTDDWRLAVYTYRNTGVLVSGRSRSGMYAVKARMNGTKAQLFVAQYMPYSSTRALVLFSPVLDATAIIRDFVIFRQLTGSTIPENSGGSINGVALPDMGQINSATFLGLPAKTVLYQGDKFRVNIALASTGAYAQFIGYAFHHNSKGIITNVPSSLFGRRMIRQISGSITDNDWNDADKLGYPNVGQPTAASFAAFVS